MTLEGSSRDHIWLMTKYLVLMCVVKLWLVISYCLNHSTNGYKWKYLRNVGHQCGFQLCKRQQCSHTAQYGIDSRYQGLLSLNILWAAAQMSKISFLVPFGFDHLEIQCFFMRISCSLEDAWEGSLPQKGWSWPCDFPIRSNHYVHHSKPGQLSSFLLVKNHLQHINTSRKTLDISSVASATLKLFMTAHCFWPVPSWRVATTLEVSGM